MSIFASRLGFAFVLVVLCLGGRTAHAQVDPLSYWIPDGPFGFGGNSGDSQGSNTYSNFPSFDESGFSTSRYNFSNGWFVGSEGGAADLSMSSFDRYGALGNFGSLYYEGVQFGYNLSKTDGLPVTVYAGFDTLKYDTGLGGPLAPFDSTSGTLPGYGMHAGVAFRPTSNTSLSLGFSYTQQQGGINSLLLPGASPVVRP